MQAHLKCKLRLLALALVTSLRDVTLNMGSFSSSGDSQTRLGITKAGNRHVRMLLTEASQCYSRGQIGYKSKALKARQDGNTPQVIAYADKANERLRRKYYKLVLSKCKKHNVAKTAIARELACFMWGMMTDNIA
jgi:transposase